VNALVAVKEAEAPRDFAWWAVEAERTGTDWHGVIRTVLQMRVIAPCDVCEHQPCATPAFCQQCREADARAAASRRDDPHLKRLRRLMDDEISLERAHAEMMKARPTPNATVEAIKQAVRERGVAALKEPATRERLSRCDDAAHAEIDSWLAKFKTKKAQAHDV
jgi:hypothetical protein